MQDVQLSNIPGTPPTNEKAGFFNILTRSAGEEINFGKGTLILTVEKYNNESITLVVHNSGNQLIRKGDIDTKYLIGKSIGDLENSKTIEGKQIILENKNEAVALSDGTLIAYKGIQQNKPNAGQARIIVSSIPGDELALDRNFNEVNNFEDPNTALDHYRNRIEWDRIRREHYQNMVGFHITKSRDLGVGRTRSIEDIVDEHAVRKTGGRTPTEIVAIHRGRGFRQPENGSDNSRWHEGN